MKIEKLPKNHIFNSVFLQREVIIDFYFPLEKNDSSDLDLLLINDGQDLITMGFQNILEELYEQGKLKPLLCVGIHCGSDRKNEYGTAKVLNENGLGAKAQLYTRFILEELLPFIEERSQIHFKEKSFCGFSLGGLSALDIVWNHPKEFSRAGVFSGALWWRSVSQDDGKFVEDEHRIMHNEIRKGSYCPGLKFFFEAGTLDETADRNNNGIIDSIDDTVSLIDELIEKGYDRKKDILYLELEDGKHDVSTWARAFPEFLKWGWSN
jgi:enterochelin esterase-like enzyme